MILPVGRKYIVVPKLLGLVLMLMSFLFFIGASLDLVVSWDKIKDVKMCLEQFNGMDEYLICSVKAINAGVYPFPTGIDYMDKWSVLAYKSGVWVFWVFMLVVSYLIYVTGRLFEVKEVAEKPEEEEKKRGRRGRKKASK